MEPLDPVDDQNNLMLSPLVCKGCGASSVGVSMRDSGPSCQGCYDWFISFTPTITVKTDIQKMETNSANHPDRSIHTIIETNRAMWPFFSNTLKAEDTESQAEEIDVEGMTDSDDYEDDNADDDENLDEEENYNQITTSIFPNRSIRALLARDLNIYLDPKGNNTESPSAKNVQATSSNPLRGRPRNTRGKGAGRGASNCVVGM